MTFIVEQGSERYIRYTPEAALATAESLDGEPVRVYDENGNEVLIEALRGAVQEGV